MGKPRSLVFADKVKPGLGDERLDSLRRLLMEELNEKLEKVPQQAYEYTRDADYKKFAITRQMERLAKRMRYSEDSNLAAAAIDNFKSVNQQAADIRISLPTDVRDDAADFIRSVLWRYSASISGANVQLDIDFSHLFSLWRFGPGACTWALDDMAVTHPFEKLMSECPSVTEACLPYAQLMRKFTPGIRSFDAAKNVQLKIVRGSTLSTVPKNEDTHRTIATEPLENMKQQLAAGQYIVEALKLFGLDISNQQVRNKLLARLGSIFNHLATVDLKNASDLIILALIRALWPLTWYHYLSAIRSPEIYIPQEDQWLKLNMLSTMGNGFTFPVMTLTLLALVYASMPGRRNFVDFTSSVAVFGDDIILPSQHYNTLVTNLQHCGLVVNTTKSYTDGPFRESCGGDYYEGLNCTPFYVKSLRNDPEIYVAINQVIDYGERTGVWLSRTILFLAGLLQRGPFFVPVWDDPTSGIRTRLVPRRYSKWQVLPFRRRVDLSSIDPGVAMMAAVAGYITSDDLSTIGKTDEQRQLAIQKWNTRGRATSVTYTPRPKNVKYILVEARRPKGRLDGSDPRLRFTETENIIDAIVSDLR